MKSERQPVVVIGTGPIGLSAAAHLVAAGEAPVVLERGDAVAANIRRWAHVRMFTPWGFNVDPVAGRLLERHGWRAPDPDSIPTGEDLIRRYLEPLASIPELRRQVRFGATVVSIARLDSDKVRARDSADGPLVVRVRTDTGEQDILARAVIDASGTFGNPNPLGANGVPALGEVAVRDRIRYGIPDAAGRERERYAGQRVLVIGAGDSALTSLIGLALLAAEEPRTEIVWALRQPALPKNIRNAIVDTYLPERGALRDGVRDLLEAGVMAVITDFAIRALEPREDGRIDAVAASGERIEAVDRIVAATGSRPDLEMLREVRLDLDPALECPSALSSIIEPGLRPCEDIPPQTAEQLRHPEPGLWVLGSKSYGRAPSFLLRSGREQVASVVEAVLRGSEQRVAAGR